jgi:hypothetical protein
MIQMIDFKSGQLIQLPQAQNEPNYMRYAECFCFPDPDISGNLYVITFSNGMEFSLDPVQAKRF